MGKFIGFYDFNTHLLFLDLDCEKFIFLGPAFQKLSMQEQSGLVFLDSRIIMYFKFF